jgi:hypothetical protein
MEHTETLTLLAELGLGLAGFTGVAATFGGRDRVYSPADRVRIESIFTLTGATIFGSLAALTFSAAGISPATLWMWASLIAGTICTRPTYVAFTHGIALARDPEVSTSSFIVVLAAAILVGSIGLHLGNLTVWREAWPLFAASSLQLAWGVFLFARILTQRN